MASQWPVVVALGCFVGSHVWRCYCGRLYANSCKVKRSSVLDSVMDRGTQSVTVSAIIRGDSAATTVMVIDQLGVALNLVAGNSVTREQQQSFSHSGSR